MVFGENEFEAVFEALLLVHVEILGAGEQKGHV